MLEEAKEKANEGLKKASDAITEEIENAKP